MELQPHLFNKGPTLWNCPIVTPRHGRAQKKQHVTGVGSNSDYVGRSLYATDAGKWKKPLCKDFQNTYLKWPLWFKFVGVQPSSIVFGFYNELSSEKKPWLFRVYRGWKTTQLYGDYFINHCEDPVLKQPVWLMESIRDPGFFLGRGSIRLPWLVDI